MKVMTIHCKECNDTIYSRAAHDYRSCSCHNVSIDGGRDYTKIGYKKPDSYTIKLIDLGENITNKELYDDWNQRINKFGKINE